MPRAATRAAPQPRTSLDVIVEHAGWEKAIAEPVPLLRRAAKAALAVARRDRRGTKARSVGIAVALIDDRAMRKLNRAYRGKDKPTNVLSFPASETEARGRPGKRQALGDIAIALGTLRREAEAQGKTLADHLAHLMVHAVLHLLGYDHESKTEAEHMESLERRALAGLGIADPYRR